MKRLGRQNWQKTRFRQIRVLAAVGIKFFADSFTPDRTAPSGGASASSALFPKQSVMNCFG
ncbi:MAG: hypothetical protein C6P37_09270 [Caldibacillus debilis]|jgi:hypothetical protein|uniref:Uncharacterized protein n=1 Tax=Caldibacillus debilis TaxID=301148 RepID=A0A3E0K4B1_9BACI|nr:MAG: hypothetical protein C6W57_00550 [Caldibacillus debilis]REJ28031.1 MAG: hypothetical protein C6P37_09270 [Caldibacillus debilis]